LKTPIQVDHVNRLGWTCLLEVVLLGDGGNRHQQVAQMVLSAGADPKGPGGGDAAGTCGRAGADGDRGDHSGGWWTNEIATYDSIAALDLFASRVVRWTGSKTTSSVTRSHRGDAR